MRESIKSIENNINGNVSCAIYDNASKDGSRDYLIGQDGCNGFDFWCNETNIGKAKALNWLVDNRFDNIKDDDLIFSLDSDLRLVTEKFFDKVQSIWDVIGNKVSCIVCKQTGNSLYKRNIAYRHSDTGNFNYFVPEEGYGHGVAGGALIVPYKYWKQVGGYNEDNGLYGGNDGNLMLRLFQDTGKPICVIEDLRVFHPFEDNKEYQAWKDTAHQQQMVHGKCIESKGFFD